MEHRGACGGDGVSGEGAGIMTQVPWKLFVLYTDAAAAVAAAAAADVDTPGVGMVFLPREDAQRRAAIRDVIERVCVANKNYSWGGGRYQSITRYSGPRP